MNIVGVRKHINKLYKDAYKIIKNEFFGILNSIYEEVYDEAAALGYSGDFEDLDEGWIEEFFDEYNPVTKYVFKNELERKKAYLFESLIADPKAKLQSYVKAEKSLVKQVKQYGIDLYDAVAKAAFKAAGVKRVQWIAEDDSKTCSVCRELDNQIFDLDKAPPKQHHNCRCYLRPIRDR